MWRIVASLAALYVVNPGAKACSDASALAADIRNQAAAQQVRITLDAQNVGQINPVGATQRTVELGGAFKLHNGETALVGNEGLTLQFERVTRDGRCPIGDPCTSDIGDATVLVTVQQPPHEPAALQLHTHPDLRREAQYLRYRVQLTRLEPRPVGEQPVPLPQYRATFIVSEMSSH
jgi:hypothetical protein